MGGKFSAQRGDARVEEAAVITTGKQLATLLVACAFGFGVWCLILFFIGGLR